MKGKITMNEQNMKEVLEKEAKKIIVEQAIDDIYAQGYNDATTFALGTLGGIFTAGFLIMKGWTWWNSRKK